MRLLFPCFALTIVFSGSAYSSPSTICSEPVTNEIIQFLEKLGPSADLHLFKNSKGVIVGIVDTNTTYPTIDFIQTKKVGSNKFVNIYEYGSIKVFAHYNRDSKKGSQSCKTTLFSISTDPDDD